MKIALVSHRKQTVFNLRRWDELLADPDVVKIEGRIETDRHGHVILNPIFPTIARQRCGRNWMPDPRFDV